MKICIMNNKIKKLIFAIVLFSVMGGVYAGIISLGNRYLRNHDLLNPYTEGLIVLILYMGMYFIYRRFSRRLDRISKSE